MDSHNTPVCRQNKKKLSQQTEQHNSPLVCRENKSNSKPSACTLFMLVPHHHWTCLTMLWNQCQWELCHWGISCLCLWIWPCPCLAPFCFALSLSIALAWHHLCRGCPCLWGWLVVGPQVVEGHTMYPPTSQSSSSSSWSPPLGLWSFFGTTRRSSLLVETLHVEVQLVEVLLLEEGGKPKCCWWLYQFLLSCVCLHGLWTWVEWRISAWALDWSGGSLDWPTLGPSTVPEWTVHNEWVELPWLSWKPPFN